MFKKNQQHLQAALISNINELPEKLRQRLDSSWAGVFRREFFMRIQEEPFAVLFSDLPSRPNTPVNVLVGLETLKAGFGWSDEELYDHFCYDVQVRYALGYDQLGEGHFELRTLYNFRRRLSQYNQEHGVNLLGQAFEDITDQQVIALQVRTGIQRMDSTQVASNILDSSRLQLAIDALRRVQRMLSAADQARYADWLAPYLEEAGRQARYRIKDKAEIQKYLQRIGEVICKLLDELRSDYAKDPFFPVLERFFFENYDLSQAEVLPKENKEISSGSLQSLDDLEASYRKKGNQFYKGYVANVTETCDPENEVQLITHVQVAPNNTEDSDLMIEATPNLKERTDLETLYTDGLFGSSNADEVLIAQNVEQVQTKMRGKEPDPDKFGLADFDIQHDEKGKPVTITCPAGETIPVEPGRTTGYLARFNAMVCERCPYHLENRCRAKPQKRIPCFSLSFTQQQVNWARRRRRHLAFMQEEVNLRVAIEATIRETKHPFREGKLPVRGLFRITCMMIASAAMTNVRHIYRHSLEKDRKANKEAFCAAQLSRIFRSWAFYQTCFSF
ncbi:MAG: transposase [Anaerolineales bacterium]|nr:transposase [Chloroflexota bacterium]MBL6979692.1 transposase [Anaerolineales bacterium]